MRIRTLVPPAEAAPLFRCAIQSPLPRIGQLSKPREESKATQESKKTQESQSVHESLPQKCSAERMTGRLTLRSPAGRETGCRVHRELGVSSSAVLELFQCSEES